MNGEQPYVSVVEPLSPAIDWVKTVLFRPFDLGKWFVIGFCAWLAQLGKSPGGGMVPGVRTAHPPKAAGVGRFSPPTPVAFL